MPTPEESTLHKGGENVPLESAGPYREALEPQINAEITGQGEAASPPKASRDGSQGEKDVPNVTGANPKRTINSRPD